MVRRCDGKDPNLIKYVDEKGLRCEQRGAGQTPVPCDCGRTFDDVRHSVIWPHRPI